MRSFILCGCLLVISGLQHVNAQTAYAIVEDEQTEVVCADSRSFTCHEQLTLRLLDEHAADLASFSQTLDKDDIITSFSVVVSDTLGRVLKKVKLSDLKRSELSSGLADDGVRLFWDYTPPTYPIIIHFDWEMRKTNGFISFIPFFPQPGYNMAVKKSSYVLQLAKGMKCDYKVMNSELHVEKSLNGQGQEVMRVSVCDLPPIEKGAYSLPPLETLPYVLFAPQSFYYKGSNGRRTTWEEFGKWQWDLLQGRQELPYDMRERIHQMTDTCTSLRSKVQQLYNLLESTTRYVSIQLGIGGLQPFPASEVCRLGFGDCKGLSNYMRAMLAEASIPSCYTIISTKNKRVPADFPAASHFNHAILMVPLPADTLWLECTAPSLPLGYIHDDISGHNAVYIGADGKGHFITLPSYADSLNTVRNVAKINLLQDGSATIDILQQNFCHRYRALRHLSHLKPDARRNHLLSLLYTSNTEIQDFRIEEYKESFCIPHMDISANLQCGKYSSSSGKRLFVPIFPIKQELKKLAADTLRKQDIVIENGWCRRDEIDIVIPEGYHVESLPKDVIEEIPEGSLYCSVWEEENIIHVRSRFNLNSGRYPKEDFEKLRQLFEKVVVAYRNRVVLNKQ